MTIEAEIQALLGPLVSGRCYPIDDDDPSLTNPYIIFTILWEHPEVSLDGPIGLSNDRVQVDVFGSTYSSAKTISRAVTTAFEGSSIDNVPITYYDGYVEETKEYRSTLEYSIWHRP